MAYRDFAAEDTALAHRRITFDSGRGIVAERPALAPDEWAVVDFAERDGLWSLNPDGLLQRLSRMIFGLAPPQPLANERLEALRRFAVAAWQQRITKARLDAFADAGFTSAEANLVADHIARRLKLGTWPQGLA